MRRLLLRPGAIGDCILSMPALEHLSVEYTEVWISSPVVPLIRCADKVLALARTGIDMVGVTDGDMQPHLRSRLESFDFIVSWYGANRPEFRRELLRVGVPCEFHSALPPNDYPGHAAEFFARQVGASPEKLPHITAAHSQARGTVVIHPFSGGAWKNWPLAKFQALAAELGREVEWTAGPEEALAGAHRFENLADLANFLFGAALYIGNDSGISHLAAAMGIPTLVFFGPTDPRRWAPRGPHVTVIAHEPLAELAVDEVLAVANRLLGSP